MPRLGAEERWALSGLVATFVVAAAWWALALWPVADAPDWLTRTRFTCFGAVDNGLPDAGGWIGLIGGPLGMLSIVVVGWNGGVRSLIRRAPRSIPVATALAALTAGSMLMIAGAGLRMRQAQASQFGGAAANSPPAVSYPRLDRPAPALQLVGQDGAMHDLAALRGVTVLVTFAYAHCETVCPVVVHDVLAAQRKLGRVATEPAVLVVTLDPWRDTPSRLAAIAQQWGFPQQNAWILSGNVAEVERVLRTWNVPWSRNEQNGEVTHPSVVYIIDARGRIAYATNGGVETISELARRASGPS